MGKVLPALLPAVTRMRFQAIFQRNSSRFLNLEDEDVNSSASSRWIINRLRFFYQGLFRFVGSPVYFFHTWFNAFYAFVDVADLASLRALLNHHQNQWSHFPGQFIYCWNDNTNGIISDSQRLTGLRLLMLIHPPVLLHKELTHTKSLVEMRT